MSVVSPVTADATVLTGKSEERSRSALGLKISDYAGLCRPRIAVMSAVSIAAGFTLGSTADIDWSLMVNSILGIVCFVAASSILNQVIERGSDGVMSRTEERPLVTGRISPLEGWLFGCTAIAIGSAVLLLRVNVLTWVVSLLTMATYVAIYTPLKRRTAFCTTIGAVPGAMPPVLGWFAAGRAPGMEALALFALFFVWQFPHFLAIGWIYRDQYRQAGLKMLPSYEDEGSRAGLLALCYAAAFVPVCCVPRFIGLAGAGYLCAAVVMSLGYLWLTVRFWQQRNDQRARQLMLGSLLCLPSLLFCLVLDFVRLTSSF
ncbi:MAG: protoheme IX farnesyltransferase [Planctomyces sp.]|nr:protoheme IX farnesyltransferase [Planctomyces sp.]